jgi:hypothetical protein
MSSFTIIGFFALASGRRVQTVKPGTTTRKWHAHYSTTIQCIKHVSTTWDISKIVTSSTNHISPQAKCGGWAASDGHLANNSAVCGALINNFWNILTCIKIVCKRKLSMKT